MALPRALQEQLDQANAQLAAMNQPPEPPAPADPSPQDPPAPADPEPAPEPVATVVSEPPAPQEPQAQTQPQPDVWEHKYKTLQGLFNREVPNLQNQVKELQGQLRDAVNRLNAAADAHVAQAAQVPADPKDVENFGQDLVDMVNRVAQASLGGAAKQFEARLAQLESALQGTTQTVAVNAEQSFFDRLAKLVPDWEQTNANQAFLAWLSEVDPILGQPRQAALDAAQQALNSDRAAAVFKAFAVTLPQAPAKPSASVDKQVSPKGSAASAPPTPNQPKVWTQDEVIRFYEAKRKGEFRGREADMQALEAAINLAMAEGRIR